MTKTEMQQRLKNIQQEAKELEESIGELDSKQGRWKPEEDEGFWFVESDGDLECYGYVDSYHEGLYDMGNVFETEEEAELHKLRLESMANRWMPEEKEFYFIWSEGTIAVIPRTFSSSLHWDIAAYWMGNCHKTEVDAIVWGKKYAKAFSLSKK